jgi:hypothetical protein
MNSSIPELCLKPTVDDIRRFYNYVDIARPAKTATVSSANEFVKAPCGGSP